MNARALYKAPKTKKERKKKLKNETEEEKTKKHRHTIFKIKSCEFCFAVISTYHMRALAIVANAFK